MKIPNFVYENGGKKDDWLPAHDILPEDGKMNLPSNKLKWWFTNFKIRRALTSIKKKVDSDIQTNLRTSLYIISETSLAKFASVSRASLTHPKRRAWVLNECNLIRSLVNEARSQMKKDVRKEEELGLLKIQLINARKETFVWYNKVLKLEQDLAGLQKVIGTLKKALNSGNGSNNSRLLGLNKTS